MDIIALPALRDNYIWLLRAGTRAVVVDPGEAAVVDAALAAHGLSLAAILVTHHHADHTGGIAALRDRHGAAVYGPAGEAIATVGHPRHEGDCVRIDGFADGFTVLEVPGHTSGHIAWLHGKALFCGDTLFSAGCGRLLGGSAAQLHASLRRLADLPDDTAIYCAHEYTLANLAFARAVEAHNPARDAHAAQCAQRRAHGLPTLPSQIAVEKRINPFLRTSEAAVRAAVAAHCGRTPADDAECFAELRRWKDSF
ncbi:hydroxyacylglutathione hydrolase [Pseudothauera lacus]|uniref:Hydroxyacylglutathione hydrolase n=1 Tax=Pseudothauera lacus TaxID=2136175 RepID=A0A2T4IJY5_9RHOO|nr:hydroxyacylglutathione hydrolase [Pseudothauera lacus]PTD98046.1 hydroxyacylglutathione hydrolase [Pseudothauera lacus]